MPEFEKKPGESLTEFGPLEMDGGYGMIMADKPDYVNLPPDVMKQLGVTSQRANVLQCFQFACPSGPYKGHPVRTFLLDVKVGDKQLYVAVADQFYWYTK